MARAVLGQVSSSTKVLINLLLNISFLLLVFFFLSSGISSSLPPPPQSEKGSLIKNTPIPSSGGGTASRCDGIRRFESYEEKCNYLIDHEADECAPQGYINYLQLLYCFYGSNPALGYTMLMLWLLVLFYLLGNTAAVYFCSNLEGLANLLKLSPTIAGVTLLSLGNGAPDALSTLVSFVGNGTTAVGLNSVLGGAFFVSSVVLGIISIRLHPCHVRIDRYSFVRDVCFLLCILACIFTILVIGKITIWGAVAFASLYLVYVLLVSIRVAHSKVDEEACMFDEEYCRSSSELQNFAKHSESSRESPGYPLLRRYCDDGQQKDESMKSSRSHYYWQSCIRRVVQVLELPLSLPRRLTIPDVCEERWSKPFAVASVTLAPMLLAAICDSTSSKTGSPMVYIVSGIIGLVFCLWASVRTEKERPPSRFLLPWLAGGFVMSVTWAYIVAQELLSLLVCVGLVLAVDSSVLGLTVLAWGNSLGDLIANVAVAMHGGPAGAQVAVSGCYGGPVFNTLVGLGLSLVLSCWAVHPSPLVVRPTKDLSLFQTLGFLAAGLLWALLILPRRGMRVDRVLGCGLLCIYLCFLSLSISQSFGLLGLQ